MGETTFHEASVDVWGHVVACAARGLKVFPCIAELIDNSFDWGATVIQIHATNKRSFRIRDNGEGIKKIKALVRFGGHVPHPTRIGSGTFGVGFKEAALCLGGERSRINVRTVHDGELTQANIAWELLKTQTRCMESSAEPESGTASYTDITIEPLRMRFPEGEERGRLLDKLGYIYAPALKRGAIIQITSAGKMVQVEKWKPPALEEHIEASIQIGCKKARLYAGILKEGQRTPYTGLSYMHGYRVVKEATKAGCGSWSTSRIWGFVEMDAKSGWQRTTNKTDLVDADDLYEEVERLMEPMLRKAAEKAHTVQLEECKRELEDFAAEHLLPELKEKAKRGRGNRTGSKNPTGKGGRHEQAENTQPGATMPRKRASRPMVLNFIDGWRDGECVGMWETTRGVTSVDLYQDHPGIATAMEPFDTARIYEYMAAILTLHPPKSGQTLSLFQDPDALVEFARRTASLSARIDGVPVHSARHAAE
jgi:hypothetical protein